MVWLFADDLNMLFTDLNFHDDLWRLYSWNICNGMIANACKTKCLHFNGSAKISTTQHEVLENVSSHKDLGLYISNDLKWGFHVTSKLCKARQCFFSLKAKIPFNTPSHVKLHLYRSLVLSVLLYGFPAWYPMYPCLKNLRISSVPASYGYLDENHLTWSNLKTTIFCHSAINSNILLSLFYRN